MLLLPRGAAGCGIVRLRLLLQGHGEGGAVPPDL